MMDNDYALFLMTTAMTYVVSEDFGFLCVGFLRKRDEYLSLFPYFLHFYFFTSCFLFSSTSCMYEQHKFMALLILLFLFFL